MYRLVTTMIILTGCFVAFFLYQHTLLAESIVVDRAVQVKQYQAMKQASWDRNKVEAALTMQSLLQNGCIRVNATFEGEECETDNLACLQNKDSHVVRREPICVDYGVGRVETPEVVKGIYMTSLAAGSGSLKNYLLDLLQTTELNTVVIDLKEVDGYTGTILGDNERFPFQKDLMGDVRELIRELHSHDIYVIGRIVLFKDKAWAAEHPEHAVQRRDNPGVPWTDYGGKKFIDVGAEPFWDYLVDLSSATYELGFDEIQADYIRFPSDGKMSNTLYPYSQQYIDQMGGEDGRVYSLTQFMKYYTGALRDKHPDIVLSADVFGMVATNRDDLTIGQKLEPFLMYFDYVSPMVYPSHYPVGFLGLSGHPDNHPYEVVYHSENIANQRRAALVAELGEDQVGELRPWIQDFTCTWCKGYFRYGADEVREQIQASYDAGDSGWLLWNAANRYTRGGLLQSENNE